MRYNPLGESQITVSEICLGTMTYGHQNTMAEAHAQLDHAVEQGVNFIDAAEMYPVPTRQETQGLTETYIGEWLKHQPRESLIIATKVAGPGRGLKWMRGGPTAVDRANVKQALEDSLKRLQTDYIDLYQIHWPDRYVPIFGQTVYDPAQARATTPIVEQLEVFAELIQAGRIRALGLSNETPWGVTQFSQIADQLRLPKVASIQNAYNLINRVFDSGLAEACHHEKVGLLAYSPLGFGLLSGKYLGGEKPANSRFSLYPSFGQRYHKPNVDQAVAAYAELAQRHQLSLTQLAIAFVRSRWFVSSTIIGATTLKQLAENIDSIQIQLSPEILTEIDIIHQQYPSPAP